ncbi:DNA polymerase [Ralstonia phage AhaGv]|nr:DNA polymerase [Ralstonia phage AhaGv]
MQIECILKRQGGTKVTLEGVEYHFAPLEDAAHVAEVESEPHVKRLLSIDEAYRPYRPASATGTPQTVVPTNKLAAPPPFLLGSDVHPAVIDLGDSRTVQLGEVVARAHAASGLTVEQWNALDADARHAQIDAMLDTMADEMPQAPDRTALAEQYKVKFGKAPHGKWTVETIQQKLASGEA